MLCCRILVMIDVIWRSGQRRRAAAGYLTFLSLGLRKQVSTDTNQLVLMLCVTVILMLLLFSDVTRHCLFGVMKAIWPAEACSASLCRCPVGYLSFWKLRGTYA